MPHFYNYTFLSSFFKSANHGCVFYGLILHPESHQSFFSLAGVVLLTVTDKRVFKGYFLINDRMFSLCSRSAYSFETAQMNVQLHLKAPLPSILL